MKTRTKMFLFIMFFLIVSVINGLSQGQEEGQLLFIRMPDEDPIVERPTEEEISDFLEEKSDYLDMTARELTADREFARQVLGQKQVFIELSEFYKLHNIKVKVKFIPWPDAFRYYDNYVSDPTNTTVVVQLGDTWEAYFKSLHVLPYAQRHTWDVRLLWYWKDMVNPEEIEYGEGFEKDCRRLYEEARNERIAPFVIPTVSDWDLLHNLSIWLYNAGVEEMIVSEKKFHILPWKEAKFAGIEGQRAVQFLINMAKKGYIDLPERTNVEITEAFLNRKYAMTIMPPWVAWRAERKLGPGWQEKIGTTLPPKIGSKTAATFKGGSLIVVLNPGGVKKMEGVDQAKTLVDFLCSEESERRYSKALGAIPAHPKVLEESPYYDIFKTSLNKGKNHPQLKEWAPVVENLATRDSLYALWKRLAALTDTPSYRRISEEEQNAREKLIIAALKSAEEDINEELSPGKMAAVKPWLIIFLSVIVVLVGIFILRNRFEKKRVIELRQARVRLADMQHRMNLIEDARRQVEETLYSLQNEDAEK